jgi:hypothetical protein
MPHCHLGLGPFFKDMATTIKDAKNKINTKIALSEEHGLINCCITWLGLWSDFRTATCEIDAVLTTGVKGLLSQAG